jgi:hypothetical protein
MSNTGSSSVKFLKSMCLNNVKPRINAINAKNKFISFLLSIFYNFKVKSTAIPMPKIII